MRRIKYFILQQVLPRLYAYSWRFTLRLLALTWRYEVHGKEAFNQGAKENKTILMMWHHRFAIVPELLRQVAPTFYYTAFVSASRDGMIVGHLAKSFRQGEAVCAHKDTRHHALKQLIEHLEKSDRILLYTPDGPKGPSCKVKPGIAITAQKTGAHIYPLAWEASRCWQLPTWDKMKIPKPFAKLIVKVGEPITLSPHESLPSAQERLEESLSCLFDH